MTFTDAAAEVLRLVGKPLHYKEITDIAIEKNLLSHVGKSPEVTMGARLAAMLKKDTDDNPLVRVKPGVFALRAWDDKTIKSGLDGGGRKGARKSVRPSAKAEKEATDDDGATQGEDADGPESDASIGAAGGESAGDADDGPDSDEAVDSDDEPLIPAAPKATASRPATEPYAGPTEPDELMRAEAVAGATEMFDEEDDDDQPILGGDDRAAAAGDGDGRRRRRRRRRGRGGEPGAVAAPTTGGGSGGLPTYTAVPVDSRDTPRRDEPRRDEPRRDDSRRDDSRRDDSRRDSGRSHGDGETGHRGPQVIELSGGDGQALDDLTGRDLADAIASMLGTFDRNAGAVSLRQIADAAQRRGRLAGDVQLVQSQIAAAVRTDNHRRVANGQRPRFRFTGGRVALTDWLLSSDLARLEQEAVAAIERYRDGARRAFARKLAELPGHAFVELCMLLLERMGMGQVRAVRRPGAPGGEAHFTGVLRAGSDEIKAAIVIRRDGREIGRERVVELRGSLHHYGPATVGWLLTSGQVLSGAREEAGVPATAPVGLYDGLLLARLCEDHEVAVIRARMPIAIPDVDLLEALRAS